MTLHYPRCIGGTGESHFVSLLRAFVAAGDLSSGAALHARYVKSHVPPTTFLANHLLLFYSRLGLTAKARRLFDEMPHPNVFSHNALLAAHAHDPRLAAVLFSRIHDPDLVSHNTLLAAFASGGLAADALRLFLGMRRANFSIDGFTVSSVISAVTGLAVASQLHAFVVTSGLDAYVSVKNSLMSGYGKVGFLKGAEMVFSDINDNVKNHVSWNCMIAVYGQHRDGRKALVLFQDMARSGLYADTCTLASVLSAFAAAQDLHAGIQLHTRLIKSRFESGAFVGSGLVDLYAKCGSIRDAWKAFDEVDKPDLVLWNTLISGYSLHEEVCEGGLICFRSMQRAGFFPDDCSFVCVIRICSNMSSPSHGQQLHALVIKSEITSNRISVNNAMITLYSRCGKVAEAKMLFDRMPERNTVSYNSIIAGLAQHGHAVEALGIFKDMLDVKYDPTAITLISVLSACAHTGKVDEGWDYFNSMKLKYGIQPCEEHYSCMVDLLARAKKFEKAKELIMTMPFNLSSVGWTALLGGCRTHGNMEVGERAAKEILHSSPSNASAYVMLSNMYASAGKWEEAGKIRKLMRDRGVRKKPGCSWIELGRIVHVFVADDISHPRIKEVYMFLEVMLEKLRLAGYVPDMRWALARDHAVEGERRLRHHSEKLAVAFGLISTQEGAPILVIKNLRICGDCHNAIKYISALTCREITVRDAHRFHCFREGSCSCGDYW